MTLASQHTQSQAVSVKLLLAGGHEYTLKLNSDAPLLHELLTTLVDRSQSQRSNFSGLFQIPVNEGRSVIYFPSEHLLGLVTEPPIFLEPVEEIQPEPKDNLVSRYVQIDNFLTDEERDRLLNYVFQQEKAFVSTNTSTDALDYRRSQVLYSFPNFSELIVNRIQAILPDIISKLELPPFPISQIETQLTSHNDGNYYKLHNDNGSSDTATRELTYVYYFYREPKPFAGGELLIYDSKIENNYYVKADSFNTVEPRNNSIVFFLSRYMHEVLPVRCPSRAFRDSRFTVNGWLRR
ncbi:MAG: 2OG-Fe(II) oxygenase [Myxacorys californica WJT36-NPBG1]|jgi:Rps23 Pro-64 3,4-dihydroxylase Tpa1-like proline 4-hydroxylase|nr:2OG-Fe(II) oxygenase [Myxacorys californica WJT36-NPBG1]